MDNKNLRLSGTSEEDLRIISAHLQDSITQVKNIVHLKRNRIVLIEFNRFMWEDVEKGVFRKSKRIQSILKFENVLNVYSSNINQNIKNRFLDFLAIETKLLSDKRFPVFKKITRIKIICFSNFIKINYQFINEKKRK